MIVVRCILCYGNLLLDETKNTKSAATGAMGVQYHYRAIITSAHMRYACALCKGVSVL